MSEPAAIVNGVMPPGVFARFKVKVQTGQLATDCWEWTGGKQPRGYGTFGVGSKTALLAHRLAYEHFLGPIPKGLELDHLCRNTSCVNPSHLEPVTHRENVARGANPCAVTARTGICKRGHSMQDAYVRESKGKTLRSCRHCVNSGHRAERRAKLAAMSEAEREAFYVMERAYQKAWRDSHPPRVRRG